MKILYFTPAVIKPLGHGAAAVLNYHMFNHLIKAGHDVHMLYTTLEEWLPDPDESLCLELGAASVHTIIVPKLPLKGNEDPITRRVKRFFGIRKQVAYVENMTAKAVREINPDICFIFTETIYYIAGLRGYPIFAWLSNQQIPHRKIHTDIGLYKLFRSTLLARLYYPLWERLHLAQYKRWVDQVDLGLCPSAWYGNIYKKLAARPESIKVIDHPAFDEANQIGHETPSVVPSNSPYKIAVVGHLVGTFNVAAFIFIANEILPELDRGGLSKKFEFILIGKGKLQPEFIDLLSWPNVKQLGFVTNLAEAVNQDAVLQAMPYAPGIGARLSTLTSMYPALVLHRVIEESLVEFQSGKNCLTASTGAEFVAALERICSDRELNRRLRIGARGLHDSLYAFDIFENTLESVLRDVAMKFSPNNIDSRPA